MNCKTIYLYALLKKNIYHSNWSHLKTIIIHLLLTKSNKLPLKKCFPSLKLLIYDNSSLSLKFSAYEKSALSLKCPGYEMSCLWNVLSMKYPVYKMSCLWNVLSLKYPLYTFVIHKTFFYEMSQQHFIVTLNSAEYA